MLSAHKDYGNMSGDNNMASVWPFVNFSLFFCLNYKIKNSEDSRGIPGFSLNGVNSSISPPNLISRKSKTNEPVELQFVHHNLQRKRLNLARWKVRKLAGLGLPPGWTRAPQRKSTESSEYIEENQKSQKMD